MADDTAGTSSEGFEYRPHLDGLRAVAVYLVVLFHAGLSRFSGGFIGVDVFFVLSGFLVTSLLLGELRSAGRVSLLAFYARRARRLLPAAALGLVASAWVYSMVASPLEQTEAAPGLRWAALYVSNWWFIRESADYFGTDIASSPVAHYWSLSVEEQFYILWPLALLGMWWICGRWRSRRLRAVQVMVAGLGSASLVAALVIGGTDVDRAYYGTDTRAYQLLAGALLALTPDLVARTSRSTAVRRSMSWVSVVLVVALVALGSSIFDLSPITRGAIVACTTVALLVALESADGGPGRWLLSRPSMVYLGRISYGTYLWHWLVLIVISSTWSLGPVPAALVTAAVATGLASLSYHLLEMPIRVARPLGRVRLRPMVVAVGVAMSLLVGLVITPELLDGTSPGQKLVSAEQEGGTRVDVDVKDARFDRLDHSTCEEGVVLCPLRSGGSRRAVLVGESHAGMLVGLFTELAERYDIELVAGFLPYCPWTDGVAYHGVGRQCLEHQDLMYEELLPQYDPDIVILAHRAVDDPADPMVLRTADGRLAAGDQTAALDESITGLVGELRSDGRTVVVVEPVPIAADDDDPTECLSGRRVVEPCRFVTRLEPGGEEQIIRRLDEADDGVVALDLDRLVCPYLPICDPVVDGMVVRSDSNHLTLSFATSLAPAVEEMLLEARVISR